MPAMTGNPERLATHRYAFELQLMNDQNKTPKHGANERSAATDAGGEEPMVAVTEPVFRMPPTDQRPVSMLGWGGAILAGLLLWAALFWFVS